MAFQNLLFLFFLFPVLLLTYQLLPQKLRKGFLILFSLMFYAWGEPYYVMLLMGIILINYVLARHLDMQEGKARKQVLIIILIANLFLLFYFKYYGFILEEIASWIPLPPYQELPPMPLGISFYLFSILSYQIDIYRRKIPAEKRLSDLALYIAWFPKLIMGPIMRYADFQRQLPLRSITKERLEKGLVHFVIGMVQKVWIANQLSWVWQQAQDAASTGMAWLGILAYTLQIYYDFQGYTQMAIGLSEIFGIRLPENFIHPYGATSITAFWRRWHVSLSMWFRDYVYIPLGGNRKGKGIQIRNLLIVWGLTGIWHGASWNFIIWGLYYGILLIFEKFYWSKIQQKLPSLLNWAITFLLVMIGWVFFASPDIQSAIAYLMKLIPGALSWSDGMFLQELTSCWWVLLVGLLWSTPYFENLGDLWKQEKADRMWILQPLGIGILWIVMMVYSAADTIQSFLYFQF